MIYQLFVENITLYYFYDFLTFGIPGGAPGGPERGPPGGTPGNFGLSEKVENRYRQPRVQRGATHL